MDIEPPLEAEKGGDVPDADTAEPATDESVQPAAENTAEAGDVPQPADADLTAELKALVLDGEPAAGLEGELAEKDAKPKKNKEPRYPHWHSLRS
jgi:hypothetical protein